MHTSGFSCHTPAADTIKWALLETLYLVDIFHIVYDSICAPPPGPTLSTSESSVLPHPEDVPGIATSIVYAPNCSVEKLLQRGTVTTIMKHE